MSEAKAETKGMVMMSCDFQIKGQIPKEAFELFAAAQAQILGLRGYIMQVSENCFQGQLQGPQLVIETFKQVILSVAEYVAAVKEFVLQADSKPRILQTFQTNTKKTTIEVNKQISSN
ncbi:uncharacterized protein LOC117194176 [Drosophila miranda]|uniref:uncharacterized protein LOC117194176 n=1 Tax=Drosophila miranda TaxID=7229 RepID=UPI00143F078B|nr:uncharacterized protein LOC117194176 [Drosophila miranda]